MLSLFWKRLSFGNVLLHLCNNISNDHTIVIKTLLAFVFPELDKTDF